MKLLRFEFSLSELFQAYKWYELGHQRGHFASVWQRSLYNVHGLKAQPWWTPKETGYTELVKVSVNFVESLSVSSSKFRWLLMERNVREEIDFLFSGICRKYGKKDLHPISQEFR